MRAITYYGLIYNFRVEEFIAKLDEAKEFGEDIHVKVNSQGGDVYAGWGLIQELRDYPFKKKITVHGNASSMMAVALLFISDVECLEQSQFILHRASMFREDETTLKFLEPTNNDIRKAMEEKLDIDKFEKIAGVSMDRFFDATQPIVDVQLTAKQAKAIGLIKNILPLSSKEASAINEMMVAACHGEGVKLLEVEAPTSQTDKEVDKKVKKMTLEELKRDHPNLVQAVVNEQREAIAEAAVKSERQRVKAFLAFHEVDSKAVIEGIKNGDEFSQDKMAEFTAQGLKINALAQAGAEGDGAETDGEGDEGDDATAEVKKYVAEAREAAGLKS